MPAVALPDVKTEPEVQEQSEEQTQKAPRWNVVLFDDDEHSYAYVVEMMVVLFGMSEQEGFDVAYTVDNIGQATIMTTGYEEAVEAQKKVISYGPDYRMANSRGSMACTIERAED